MSMDYRPTKGVRHDGKGKAEDDQWVGEEGHSKGKADGETDDANWDG